MRTVESRVIGPYSSGLMTSSEKMSFLAFNKASCKPCRCRNAVGNGKCLRYVLSNVFFLENDIAMG